MPRRDWDAHYVEGTLPWDMDEPDAQLVKLVREGTLVAGRALDVGCGTGTHALWLAAQGFDVLGVDIAPRAIERARQKASASPGVACRFEQLDFLSNEPPNAPFDFVFDRGCFHVFDEASEQEAFAARIATILAPGGHWLSLIGSTEGPAREQGPPRRSAREIMVAIEPHLEVVLLRTFELCIPPGFGFAPKAWACLSRTRELPAQPSTGY